MIKKLTICLAVASLLLAGSALARDFGDYTTEELSKMRGTMQNATEEEREAFRNEWQKRIRHMTKEERQKYTGRPENAECDGTGKGAEFKRGRGRAGGGFGQGRRGRGR